MQRCGLLVALWLLAGAAPPCTWDATETGSDFDRDDRAMIENDCDGRALTPYIDAVNNLNEGILVHSAGLEIAQSKYYYRLNYTRLTFDEDNWTQGEALSFQHFPSWSFIPGIGNGCNDFHVVEQAKDLDDAARPMEPDVQIHRRSPPLGFQQPPRLLGLFSAYEMQDNMTVLEEAIDWIITERVDVVLTGLLLGVSLKAWQWSP
ncbi:hypothetical protein AK812_SmicGene20690 [Symbiodinium microadriaticum]|uniref:Uncharacterized protein n=1 Tax=Symbiodinium microadriaticum TaxID=2951 RepID=A0A1Q9DPE0_SYMMI|nr:hypothetical protein AK812_SmicGene20690 [Symbiodinium microadriaticum]